MREIKFRAWNKSKSKFITWEQIKRNTSMHLFGGYFELFNRDEFIPLQFIGLKDKNGKEIYEEDILKHKDGRKVVIGWSDIFLKWNLYPFNETDDEIMDRIRDDFDDCPGDGGGQVFKIIGNVYENPKLFEEK